jgi:pimeloyl-ACP methyl ester carboxylesterase
MQAVVEGLLTNYQVTTGPGKTAKTILLLHGWGDDQRSFDGLRQALQKEYRLVSLDLPGFGQTQLPPAVWGLREYAQYLRIFMKKVKVHNLYAIIAHSNGAALAIDAVAHGQLAPKKLVLVGAAGIRNRQKARRFGLKVIAKGGKYTTLWLPRSYRRKLRKKLYGVSGSDMLVVPQLQETFKKTVRQDIQGEANQIKLPTLLIYGAKDKATPPLYGRLFKKMIADSKQEVLKDAGHFVHLDQPQQTSRLIGDFLK